MIKRFISAFTHLFAEENAKHIIESCKRAGTKSRFNTDKFENEYLGYLGESIFQQWLEEKGVKHVWQVDKFGESDDFDFLISGKKVDVKTCLRKQPINNIKSSFQLLLHNDQLGLHADIYFWILVCGFTPQSACNAYLVGSMSAERVLNYPVVEKLKGVFSRCISLADVIPPDQFKYVMED